jgi:hypothetical protein
MKKLYVKIGINGRIAGSLIALWAMIFIIGCGQNLPENYGVYAYGDKGRVALMGQDILFKGNLFQSITGLKSSSGYGFKSVTHLIVFEKDLNPKSIGLVQLGLRKTGSVSDPFGNTLIKLDFYVAQNKIEFEVAPMNDKRDMYKITPKKRLESGFYALHFGGLESMSTIEASIGNKAYDFVIGDGQYLGFENLQRRNREEITGAGERLIKLMNSCFNDKDYGKMREIYRPEGRIVSDFEWQKITKGISKWRDVAGNIAESEIFNSSISDDEGIFRIKTIYQNKGEQNETIIIRRLDGKFFITLLQ